MSMWAGFQLAALTQAAWRAKIVAGKKGNCCGADITINLLVMVGSVQAKWNNLPFLAKVKLAEETIDLPWAANLWDISGMAQGSAIDRAPPCQNGWGKCDKTVTVAGKCYLQGAVNYWLAGLIFRALGSSWFTAVRAIVFEDELWWYTMIFPPTAQKRAWFAAGKAANAAGVPAPDEFQGCGPCKVPTGKPLSWRWGFLHGHD